MPKKIILCDDKVEVNAQRDKYDTEHEIKSGDYWQHKETKEVRLIRSLDIVDNILHSVNVLLHPSTDKNKRYLENEQWVQGNGAVQFTLDEFLETFMYIEQEEARQDRDKEIKVLQEEIKEASDTLAIGYIDEEGTEAKQVLLSASSQIKTDMSLPISLAKETTVQEIQHNMSKTKDIAEKQTAFIQEHSAVIAKKTSTMATYYSEVGEQSMAAIDSTMVFVKKIEQGVHTLNIFLGEGVDVWRLSEGEPAGNKDKINFYQRKLFLDEEWFYNLAFGGADYRSLPDFQKALKEDFSIIDRIAPAEKSVVLMQFRREAKFRTSEYHSGSGSALDDLMDATADKEMFLLIRNGKNVYFVFSDDLLGGKRLFPTSTEINDYTRDGSKFFEGIEVDKHINFFDRKNVKAREAFDAKTRYYQRIILLLNGMHVRDTSIFGEINDSGYRDWLSLDFQMNNLNFVYDDEDALSWNTESTGEFLKRNNKSIQDGSRVVGLWRHIADEDNARGMWSSAIHRDNQEIWTPIASNEPLVVKTDKDGLYVSVLCSHRWGDSENTRKKIHLGRTDRDMMLCIDKVHSTEINYLLNSRRERTTYVQFARLLLAARDLLLREEKESEDFTANFMSHLVSQYPQYTQEEIKEAMFDSISFWRVKHKGITLPSERDENASSKALKEIGDIFTQRFVNNKTNDIVSFAKSNNEIGNFIRVSGNGKKYYLYTEINEESRVYIGECAGDYPFVYRHVLKITAKGIISIESTKSVLYLEIDIKEENYHVEKVLDVDSKDRTKDKNFLERLARIVELASLKNETLALLEEGDTLMMDRLDNLLTERITSFQKIRDKKRYGTITIPEFNVSLVDNVLMLSPVKAGEYYSHDSREVKVIELVSSLENIVARYGTDELYERFIEWIKKTYSRARSRIGDMEEVRARRGYIWSHKSTKFYVNSESLPFPKQNTRILTSTQSYSQCGYSMMGAVGEQKAFESFLEEERKKIQEVADRRSDNANTKEIILFTKITT